jgi:hypothetical protein
MVSLNQIFTMLMGEFDFTSNFAFAENGTVAKVRSLLFY